MNNEPESAERESFAELGRAPRSSLVSEFAWFLKTNKKWWLLPILIVFGLMCLVAVFGGSGAVPFLYTLF